MKPVKSSIDFPFEIHVTKYPKPCDKVPHIGALCHTCRA